MDWNSLKFRIAVLTSLSVSLLLVLFGGYNYSAARADSYNRQAALVEQAISRLQLSLPGPLWNYESAFIEASLKSELAADALSALLCWLLGGLVGLGTLICAFCLGPFIQFFDRTFSQKVLQYKPNN